MRRHTVAGDLLAYGRDLERSAAAQVGASFSGDESADRLIEESSNAFLFGVIFTQGIPAERAWVGPARLLERIGTLDPGYLASHADEVREAFQQPPMLHRFKETVPRWIVSAAARLDEEYGADAASIWAPGADVRDVVKRLSQFDGIGPKKAVMAAQILTRHFGVTLSGREFGQVAYDVHVRRVFLRTGMAQSDTREAVEAAARAACHESPGTLDLAAWLVGREWCRPRDPKCEACRLSATCSRLTAVMVDGVGSRRS